MDKYRIDSHKLHYHPERVAAWRQGENVYPLYMEISPAGCCNHRCLFCGLDFMEYQRTFLDTAMLKERLTELGRLGLKSAMYAGEGEPFLHKDMAELAVHTKAAGIDPAFTTNAVLMTPEVSKEILPHTSWIKVSFNAGTAETYAAIHRAAPSHFHKVLANLEAAVKLRRDNGLACTLGMQILLLPDNHGEIETLARTARDLGLDYLVVKPYSQHPQSKTRLFENTDYAFAEDLAERLEQYRTETFSPIVRLNAIRKWQDKARTYTRCLGLPFWSYMDASGNIWGCSVFLSDERFLYGNVNEQTFQEIWEGPKRTQSMQWFNASFDPSQCRINCRMDVINSYLWDLANPPAHCNFI